MKRLVFNTSLNCSQLLEVERICVGSELRRGNSVNPVGFCAEEPACHQYVQLKGDVPITDTSDRHSDGSTENAGPENEGPMRDQINQKPTARLENEGPNFQGRKMQDRKMRNRKM